MKITTFSVSNYLNTEKDAISYFEEIQKIANETNSPELIIEAIGDIARSKGISKIAKETNLNRESLYKSLGKKGNPTFSNFFKIIKSLGYNLALTKQ